MGIELTETHDGGDMILIEQPDASGKFYDLQLDGGLTTAMYMSHFGGNVEASTTGNEKPGDLRKDWWGNALITDSPDAQANSGLERALLGTNIASGNLLKIEDFAAEDLKWMLKEGIAADIKNEASIVSPDFVQVKDTIAESGTDTDFVAFWDFDKNRALQEG